MFEKLSEKLDSMDIHLSITKITNGKLLVQVKAKPKTDLGVDPPYFHISGTPQELDAEFANKLNEPLDYANQKFNAVEFYKEQLDMIVDSKSKELNEKTAPKPTATSAKKAPTKKVVEVKMEEPNEFIGTESPEEPVVEVIPVEEVKAPVEVKEVIMKPNKAFDKENIPVPIPVVETPEITIDLPDFDL